MNPVIEAMAKAIARIANSPIEVHWKQMPNATHQWYRGFALAAWNAGVDELSDEDFSDLSYAAMMRTAPGLTGNEEIRMALRKVVEK